MKKQAFGLLSMFSLLLVMTVASVNAQSKRSSINIPFNFNVGHKTLPAGEYTIEPVRRDSNNVWLVENQTVHVRALFTTIPVRNTETQKKAGVIFANQDGQYFLAQIWTAGDNSGRELQIPRQERELAKNSFQPKKVTVTRGAGE